MIYLNSMNKEFLKKVGSFLSSFPAMNELDPNPNNHPPILYKYRNWTDSYHKDVIKNNEIYMSPPSFLNDPFDCRVYENHIKFIKTDNDKEKYISESITKNLGFFKLNNISVEQGRKVLSERLENILKYQIRSEVISDKIDDKNIGITCLSEKWDSILMWSHYANNHKGYCVGFDEKLLRYSQLFDKIKRVEYSEEYPELNPLHRDKKSDELKYFVKSLEWEYEKEFRLLNLYLSGENSASDRKIQLQNNFIKEIILGLNTPKEHKKEIISIAIEKNIDIWQIIKSDFQFKIERYKL